MDSYTKDIQHTMINLQKRSDAYIDPTSGYAVSIDIDRAENKTWDVVEKMCIALLSDLERQPQSIYVCTTTVILFFRPIANEGVHIFNGSKQKIISWFVGYVNILLRIKNKEQLSIGIVTEFDSIKQGTGYFFWASQMHHRSILISNVYNSKNRPDGNLEELTITELNSFIEKHPPTRDLYGPLYRLGKTEQGKVVVTMKNGPYNVVDIDEYTEFLF